MSRALILSDTSAWDLAEQEKRDVDIERRRQYDREYYWKNREKRREQAKLSVDKEKKAAYQKQYRKENRKRLAENRKNYYAANKDRIALQRKTYRQNNEKSMARNREYQRQYWIENRDPLLSRKKAYREENKEVITERRKKYRMENKETIALRQKEYYEKNRERILLHKKQYYEINRYMLCNRMLNEYCFRSMERIKQQYPEKVQQNLSQYPFDEYAERRIKKQLREKAIYSSQEIYVDCYDAGMLAYMYCIHRFSVIDCKYANAYMKKVIRIFINCAMVVFKETQNICRANNFSEYRIDKDESYWI